MSDLIKHAEEYFNQQKGRHYPCSNQIVTCIYITNNIQEVYEYLNKNHIVPNRQGKNYIEWQENNERWIWRPISESCRGFRFYKVKISNDYNNEKMLQYIILPCCDSYCCSWEVME